MTSLKERYRDPGAVVVTAHRGFSGRYPENTLTAFREAVALGVDIVEFDVRETCDGQLVILHDATLDRTTDGIGPVAEKAWAELVDLKATYWSGSFRGGERLTQPAGDAGIPRLEETLALLAGRVGLNIQVKTQSETALRRIVDLYRQHGLEDSAFLMLDSFEAAALARAWYPAVRVCVGEARGDLDRHLAFGVDFLQPNRAVLTEAYLQRLLAAGVPFNVFYANESQDMADLLDRGVRGILTDWPDRLLHLARTRAGG